MLSDQDQVRMNELRAEEMHRQLSPVEEQELTAILTRVETEEALYLRPATESARTQRMNIETQNEALERLIARQERLQKRLERLQSLATAERQAIRIELTRVMNAGSRP